MEKIYNDTVNINSIGQTVTLEGWVAKKRDLGGLIFIDLRDRTGIIQIVVRPENKNYKIADSLKNEYVIKVVGKVTERESKNANLKTGEIEIEADVIEILNSCDELPFTITDEVNTSEDNRLKYRYLDIRRNKLKNNLLLRAEILHYLRNKMYDNGFTEIQTPILTASSPEGARDFVVPSRVFPGKFYALPQAPQIYKELLMVGGLERYFQIAPCFRDEDPRADRTLEFYQLDLEMSFVNEDDVLNVGEEIFYDTFTKFSNKKVSPRPFRRISYRDAIDMYGSDKPDLRFEMTIQDITSIFKNTEFTIFKNIIEEKGIINCIVVKNAADKYSRKDLDKLTEFAKSKKASGLAYLKIDDEITGSIAKVVNEDEIKLLKEQLRLENNDLILIISGTKKIVKNVLGQLRLNVANTLGLIDPNRLELCIINDFPMFEYDEKEDKWDFCHNPFSLPHGGIHAYDNPDDLENILAYQFDFVCNGNEMASGAIRNHDLDSLAKGFEIVGYSREEVEERFKSIFTAFKYGCPPHGGMAPGIDRLIMLIQDEPNLREVQAFPPSASGQDLMMGSPAKLTEQQLEELKIYFKEEEGE
ncbi:MAG: aspartate--tRNA ligase [Bacilli bacterium]